MKFGSASVPVYRCDSHGRERFTISYHRNGERMRQSFSSLPAAKKEALLVAQRIQQGLQHVTDLTPADRDAYMAAKKMLAESGIPLVAAIEDYLRARAIAGTESLASMAADYTKYFRKVTRKATVPEVVKCLLEAKRQDGLGERHLRQLKYVLTRFGTAFPGPILDVTTADVDQWLRGLDMALSSRNSMLRYVNVLFSFALAQNFLPEGRPIATAGLKKGKVVSEDVVVFTPEQAYISYRIAIVKSAEQVALEAGNSPSIIFKHYRELVSEEVAEKWFSILPKPDQMANRTSFDRKTGMVKLIVKTTIAKLV